MGQRSMSSKRSIEGNGGASRISTATSCAPATKARLRESRSSLAMTRRVDSFGGGAAKKNPTPHRNELIGHICRLKPTKTLESERRPGCNRAHVTVGDVAQW